MRDGDRLAVLARLGTPLNTLAGLAPALGVPAPGQGPEGLPVSAADLRARGLPDGPAMGQALAALRRRWAEDGGRPCTADLLAALGAGQAGLSAGEEAPRAPHPSRRQGSQDPCR